MQILTNEVAKCFCYVSGEINCDTFGKILICTKIMKEILTTYKNVTSNIISNAKNCVCSQDHMSDYDSQGHFIIKIIKISGLPNSQIILRILYFVSKNI